MQSKNLSSKFSIVLPTSKLAISRQMYSFCVMDGVTFVNVHFGLKLSPQKYPHADKSGERGGQSMSPKTGDCMMRKHIVNHLYWGTVLLESNLLHVDVVPEIERC